MAKSTVRSFTYVKANGEISERTVFVMAESDSYIKALDFAYLSADEQKKVQSVLADHEISGVVTFGKNAAATPIPNFNDDWKGAFRTFKKENIHVDLKEGYLTVRAEKGLEKEEKQEKKVIRSERYVGSMSRSFYVGDIEPDSIKCKYEDGVLTLEFPKENQPKLPETHSITIE